MADAITMPKLSDTMEVGVLASWQVEVGDTISAGDILCEIETDKATMEYESPFDGTILWKTGEAGDTLDIGALIAVLGKADEDPQPVVKAHQGSGSAGQASEAPEQKEETTSGGSGNPKAAEPVAVASASSSTGSSTGSTASQAEDEGRIKASPLAKKMAHEHGVPLKSLSGSGDNGRIVRRDIEAYLENGNGAAAVPQPAAQPVGGVIHSPSTGSSTGSGSQPDDYTDLKVSSMRRVIAKRLSESKFSAPEFYLTVSIDMARAAQFREQLKAEDVKVSFNDLVIKAAALALRKHPNVNATWLGDTIRQYNFVNIGVAVAVEEGLVVPVVRNADHKGLQDISGEVRDMAGRARDKKLTPDEMQGNTFSISNLGMFGIEEFTAIINPPDSCILAVGGINEVPVVENGALTIGKRMKVTLSCDHRVVDGATGAQFLQTFKYLLENPMRMLL